jgi:tRNA threonylcarbamoyl adenosine modification protein YeaZ
MKKYLIIDTATHESSISLLSGKKLTTIGLKEKSQTKEIIPLIKNLLIDENTKLSDLSGIAICIGPGLYTGTRVGAMTAKTLSYSMDIPLFPFSSFDIFKESEPYAILDAKCKRAHLFNNGTISLINHSEIDQILDPVHTLSLTPFYVEKELTLTTKDLTKLIPLLETINPHTHDQIEIYYPQEI